MNFLRSNTFLARGVILFGIGIFCALLAICGGLSGVDQAWWLIAPVPFAILGAALCLVISLFKDERRYKLYSATILLLPLLWYGAERTSYALAHHSNVAYQEINFNQTCFGFEYYTSDAPFPAENGLTMPDTLVIDTDAQYQGLLKYAVCADPTLPALDLKANTLLARYGMNAACDPKGFGKTVRLDAQAKTLTYTVENTRGWSAGCTRNIPKRSMNWIAVPAVPHDYRIQLIWEGVADTFSYDATTSAWSLVKHSRRYD